MIFSVAWLNLWIWLPVPAHEHQHRREACAADAKVCLHVVSVRMLAHTHLWWRRGRGAGESFSACWNCWQTGRRQHTPAGAVFSQYPTVSPPACAMLYGCYWTSQEWEEFFMLHIIWVPLSLFAKETSHSIACITFAFSCCWYCVFLYYLVRSPTERSYFWS